MHVHQYPTGQTREGSDHHFYHVIVEEPETYYEWVDFLRAIESPQTSSRRKRRQPFLVGQR